MTRRKANWIVSVGLICVAAATVWVVVVGLQSRPLPQIDAAGGEKPAGGMGRQTLWTEAGWTPEDFFDSEAALRACKLISERKHEELKQLLGSDFDVNQSGKKGMTLLYWAFGEDNQEAFQLLLDSGADPDKKLTEPITTRNSWLFAGDSILFTAMRKSKWDFFFAALEHTSNIDQRDVEGKTLLLACMGTDAIYGTSGETLQRIIDAGVPLDAMNKYGDTATMNALFRDRPLHCLRMLEAGADPEIHNARGRTIYDLLSIRLQADLQRGKQPPKGTDRLKQWLDAHRSKSDE
ncbi:MAG: hypothetical protein RIC55_31195 [Pirellulaceae bacterium]